MRGKVKKKITNVGGEGEDLELSYLSVQKRSTISNSARAISGVCCLTTLLIQQPSCFSV